MPVKYLFGLIFLICLQSCTDSSGGQVTSPAKPPLKMGEQPNSIHIENGPRQGFQYVDSTTKEYNYRYYTITLTNDSTIPIHLEINLAKAKEILGKNSKSKVFLLPRHLTPNQQHYDNSISVELKRFLDFDTDKTEYLNKTLEPAERCVMTFGVLTEARYSEYDPTTPYGTQLLTSTLDASIVALKLKINDALIIPCGQLSFINR